MKNKNSEFSTLNELLARMEGLFLSFIIGLVLPLALGLVGWWGSIPFVSKDRILYFATWRRAGRHPAGSVFHQAIDAQRSFSFDRMANCGFPILFGLRFRFLYGRTRLQPAVGPGVGLLHRDAPARGVIQIKLLWRKQRGRSGIFTSVVLAFACAAAMTIALLDPFLEANIQGMFGLAQPLEKH